PVRGKQLGGATARRVLPEAILAARFMLFAVVAASFLLAWSQPQPSGRSGSGGSPSGQRPPGPPKTLVVGLSHSVSSLSIMGSSTTAGGWQSLNELHSQGLVTADRDVARPVARLATEIPSLERGTITMLPDGRMKTVYALRSDVTWQDGTPFTAQD